jgi:hypothetical protein
MLECPRCGQEAEYLAGRSFVLVWCDFCDDLIEVGDLVLRRRDDAGGDANPGTSHLEVLSGAAHRAAGHPQAP